MKTKTEKSLVAFEDHKIRRVYDEKSETWFFSVVDVVAALTQQPDYQTARKYWNKLSERLKKEGSQSVTNCHRLKLSASLSQFTRWDFHFCDFCAFLWLKICRLPAFQ
jgi:hypothetical protein